MHKWISWAAGCAGTKLKFRRKNRPPALAWSPDQLASSLAALCGVSPVHASSGRQDRLNRAGSRDANRAMWVVVQVPDGLRSSHSSIGHSPHRSGSQQEGDHPVPDVARRSRDLPTAAPRRNPHRQPGLPLDPKHRLYCGERGRRLSPVTGPRSDQTAGREMRSRGSKMRSFHACAGSARALVLLSAAVIAI